MSRGDKKIVIKSTDMTDEMQQEAIETAKHVRYTPISPGFNCSTPQLCRVMGSPAVWAHISLFVSIFSNFPPITNAHRPRSHFLSLTTQPLLLLQAIDKWTVEKDIAAYIKKEFDSRHGPTWHCIVGSKFGSYVTHETKHFVYFYLDSIAVLLFKSG